MSEPLRSRSAPWLLLVLILAASLVPRLPLLWSAETTFNSDEAANALVIEHLITGKDFTFYNWGTHYYGIVEGLLALLFLPFAGFTPLAFKLAAVTGFLLLVAAVFLLGRQLYGPAEGLAAAALLGVFSPHLVMWSTVASGGYSLVAAWGTLTLVHLHATWRRPTALRLAALGLLTGFGLYIYELYLVYVAALALFALSASFLWKAALAPSPGDRAAALALAPRQRGAARLFLAGFVLGWAPKLIVLATGAEASRKPSYGFAGPAEMLDNLDLLVSSCIPALFGVNPLGGRILTRWVALSGPFAKLCGVLLLLVFAIAWLWGLRRVQGEIGAALRKPPRELGTESVIVLLVPIVALLFVAGRNPEDVLSSHYLLPWMSSLPVLAGAWLVRLGRRRKAAALALAAVLVGYPTVQTLRWQVQWGYLTAGLTLPQRRPDPLREVVRFLEHRGIRGAYGWYWIVYEGNFWSRERVIFAPSEGWDRYPAYTRFVDGLASPAYVFETDIADQRQSERAFLARLRELGWPYERHRVAGYTIYTSPRGERLLPLSLARGPNRLARPRAVVAARGVPATLRPGQEAELAVQVANVGDEPWPAWGVGTGQLRVAVSYRWLDAAGAPLPHASLRTPLPGDVPPGGAAELTARVQAPETPGSYRLVLTLVQEDVAWFADVGGGAATYPVTVRAGV